jgi:hypothetical protein
MTKKKTNKKENTFPGHGIRIRGTVEIINGKTHQICKNHFVGNTLFALTNLFGGYGYYPSYSSQGYYPPTSEWTYDSFPLSYMVLGTDTSTSTVISMNFLQKPIGPNPGTKPNTQTGTTAAITNGMQITLSSTWSAATVQGTVGELGLYFSLSSPSAVGAWGVGIGGGSPVFGTRLSVADGDFSAFTIVTSVPLTVNWTISFTYL